MSANFYDETGLAGGGVQKRFSELYRAVIARLGVEDVFEVDVTLTDEEPIRTLNAENRGVDSVTDVLSFPVMDGVLPFDEAAHEDDRDPETGLFMLGDIVISVPRAIEQAQMYGHSLRREIGFLTVHSMLHLLGYDHEGGGLEALRMREKEELVLTRLGLQRDMSFVEEEEVQE